MGEVAPVDWGVYHRPLLVAHRGDSGTFLENTAAAFTAAQRLGVDMIETDSHATRDGVAVVVHDPDFSRVSDCSIPIAHMDWQQVRKIRLRDGSSPVSVAELLL